MRIILLLLLLVFVPFSANAVDIIGGEGEYNKERLDDRLIRIEKALSTLEKSVYKSGGSQGRSTSTMQPFEQEISSDSNIEIRLSDIERKLRELTGLLEEQNFSNRTTQDKLENFVNEANFRIAQLEKMAGIESKTAFPAATSTAPQSPGSPTSMPGKSDGTRELGTIPADRVPAGNENDFGAQYDYDQAFGLLRQSKYQPAADAFRTFIDKYPKHDLIGAAYYWLGESSYVQKDYEQASVAFLQGYQENPKGDKAADNLLKLAMSLKEMGKKKEACATFVKLNKEFSGNISPALKKKADEESAKIGCKK